MHIKCEYLDPRPYSMMLSDSGLWLDPEYFGMMSRRTLRQEVEWI